MVRNVAKKSANPTNELPTSTNQRIQAKTNWISLLEKLCNMCFNARIHNETDFGYFRALFWAPGLGASCFASPISAAESYGFPTTDEDTLRWAMSSVETLGASKYQIWSQAFSFFNASFLCVPVSFSTRL